MATDKKLTALWDLFVKELVSRFEDGEEIGVGDDGVIMGRPKAATLAVVSKFLKDHHIDAPDDPNVTKLSQLLKEAARDLHEADSL